MADRILAGLEAGGVTPITLAGTVEAGDLVGYSTGWKVAKQAATVIPAAGAVDKAGVSGEIALLHTRGIIRGASGLTPGAPVYLAEDGEVSSTPGANLAQMVGIALSATEWVLAINQGVGAGPSAHIAYAAAPTSYTPHASGAVTVTSNAATDLDTTAAALDTLVAEVTTLVTKVNAIVAALEAHGITLKA